MNTVRWFAIASCTSCLTTMLLCTSCSVVAGLEEKQLAPADAGPDEPAPAADGATDAATTTDAAQETAADVSSADVDSGPDQEAGWGQPELCNLVDDNYDGIVDEGFTWVCMEWKELAKLENGVTARTERMSDGSTAVLLVESAGAGLSRLSLALADPGGNPSTAPLVVVLPAGPVAGFGLARTPDDELGVAWVEDDGAQCLSGCPVWLARYRDGALLGSAAVTGFSFLPQRLLDLTATSAGYAFLVMDETNKARLLWKDHLQFKFPNSSNGTLTGIQPNAGSLARGGAIAWILGGHTDTDQDSALFGLVTPGGYMQLMANKEIAPSGGGVKVTVHPNGRGAAWLGSGLVFGVTRKEVSSAQACAYLFGATGLSAGAACFGQGELHSVVEFRSGLLSSVVNGPEVAIHRSDRNLKALQAPISFGDSIDHQLSAGNADPRIVRLSADGTTAYIARIGCL